jgi:hypothetical protein
MLHHESATIFPQAWFQVPAGLDEDTGFESKAQGA